MSSVFEGLDELRAELRALPDELSEEGGDIVVAATNDAADAVFNGYPEGPTGHLRGGVRFKVSRSKGGASGEVKSTAQHAWMFENGTQARHTDLGANRGSMPARHVFIPAVMRVRRRMYEELKALVMRKGLEVTDDAG